MEKKTRVLAVDDDRDILQLLERALEEEGFAVTTATDGESALALLSEIKPDIILLDIRMPRLDGYEVLERIRESSNVPVLMLTGVAEETAVMRSFDLGADDYIRKPFLTGTLIARIKSKLRRARGNMSQADNA
ncbi:MAG: response regulator [Chloroflexota bacterium]